MIKDLYIFTTVFLYVVVWSSGVRAQPPANYNPMTMDICLLKPNCCPKGGRVPCNAEVFSNGLDQVRGGKVVREAIMSDSRNCAERIKATTLLSMGPPGLFAQFEASCVEPYCENTITALEELYRDSCCTCQDIKVKFSHLPLNKLVGTCDDLPAYWMCHHLGRCFGSHYNYTDDWCKQCGHDQLTEKMFYEKSMYGECAEAKRAREKAEQEAKVISGRRALAKKEGVLYHGYGRMHRSASSHLFLGVLTFMVAIVFILLVMIGGIVVQLHRK